MKIRSVAATIALSAALGLAAAADAAAADTEENRAAYTAEAVPIRPDDPAWERAQAFTIPLMAQAISAPHGGGSVSELEVRALHDGEDLALRFEWADPTADHEVGVDVFRDAFAVGFPARRGDRLPSPFMGDAEHPVNIWQWTADLEAAEKGRGEFAERYPHTEGVWYFPQDDAVTREVRAWRGARPVIELEATGFGTLARKAAQNVRGASARSDDRWRVVLRRALSTGNPDDSLFRAGDTTHLIAAVWDGSHGDVDGKKSVTLSWTPLVLEPTFEMDAAAAEGDDSADSADAPDATGAEAETQRTGASQDAADGVPAERTAAAERRQADAPDAETGGD